MNKNTIAIVAAIIVAGGLIAGAMVYNASLENKQDKVTTTDTNTDTADTKPTDSEIDAETPAAVASADDDDVLGSVDAPVTIIEFSDYECPYCGRHFSQVYPMLKVNYIDTGKVKVVFRDFPLTQMHPMALDAAIAAECAGDQGKYYEMHDMLFENQSELSIENMKTWANDLGLDTSTFDSCLDSRQYEDEVMKDQEDGIAAGVQGTPSFFVGKYFLPGAYPYEEFEKVIKAELGEE